MKRFFVTYEQTTPESSEHGDYSDLGYIMPGEWRFSTHDAPCGPAFKAWAEPYALTLSEALSICGSLDTKHHNGRTFYGHNADTICYRTGTDETRALHVPANITAASLARVIRAIEKYAR